MDLKNIKSNPDNKRLVKHTRPYESRRGRSEMGRSTIFVTCPYCGVEVECFLWSLNGSGKRCGCGAKHNGMGFTEAPKDFIADEDRRTPYWVVGGTPMCIECLLTEFPDAEVIDGGYCIEAEYEDCPACGEPLDVSVIEE